jgi:L-rhamnose mutarotase
MIRKAFVMSVDPKFHEEYERRHRPVWPEMEALLKTHGVHNYSIHLDESTHQLFGYAEIESEERWAAIAKTEICQKWWQYMKDIMPSNPDGSPISKNLREVFYLK